MFAPYDFILGQFFLVHLLWRNEKVLPSFYLPAIGHGMFGVSCPQATFVLSVFIYSSFVELYLYAVCLLTCF